MLFGAGNGAGCPLSNSRRRIAMGDESGDLAFSAPNAVAKITIKMPGIFDVRKHP
jgi:hypothetical protein